MSALALQIRAGARRPSTNHDPARREVTAVNNQIRVIDAFHADRAARFEAEARVARFVRGAQPAAGRLAIRRPIGRFIVRVGARIAADPAVERCLVAPPPATERLQPAGTR